MTNPMTTAINESMNQPTPARNGFSFAVTTNTGVRTAPIIKTTIASAKKMVLLIL